MTYILPYLLTQPRKEPDASQQEISTSWSLFILIMLLVVALFASYVLQTRRIQAVHETVMSIFAGTALLDLRTFWDQQARLTLSSKEWSLASYYD